MIVPKLLILTTVVFATVTKRATDPSIGCTEGNTICRRPCSLHRDIENKKFIHLVFCTRRYNTGGTTVSRTIAICSNSRHLQRLCSDTPRIPPASTYTDWTNLDCESVTSNSHEIRPCQQCQKYARTLPELAATKPQCQAFAIDFEVRG